MSGISRLDGPPGPARPSEDTAGRAPPADEAVQAAAARLRQMLDQDEGGSGADGQGQDEARTADAPARFGDAGPEPDGMTARTGAEATWPASGTAGPPIGPDRAAPDRSASGPLPRGILDGDAARFRHLLEDAAPAPAVPEPAGPAVDRPATPSPAAAAAPTLGPGPAPVPGPEDGVAASQPPAHGQGGAVDRGPELSALRGADLANMPLPVRDRDGRTAGKDDDAVPAIAPAEGGFRGDAILAGLGVAAPEPAAPARAPDLQQLVQTLADRVLVGQRADGTQEIRVTLRGDVLGQTEVRIARGEGGIQFHFVPATAEAGDLLRTHGNDLARTLSERLDNRVTLELAPAAGAGTPDRGGGQDPRRSRGYEDILSYVAG